MFNRSLEKWFLSSYYYQYKGKDHGFTNLMNKNKNFLILYIFFVVCFFVPSTAHAYLDPGTGNALIYVVLSLLGAIFYFIKGLFYKFLKRKHEPSSQQGEAIQNEGSDYSSIVIFSEGKNYWNTFKPVVEKLIEKEMLFSYYTMDIEDPCLTIDSSFMNNIYIGDGHVAFSKMGNLRAGVVLSTTPNIGTKGYPIPRSGKIRKLVHVFHAFDDLSTLHRGSLDYYDAALLMGEFQIPLIRKLEALRNLPEKELVPGGLPYMDELLKKAMVSKNEDLAGNCNEKKIFHAPEEVTVLLAPSWGEKGFLKVLGPDFIRQLAEKRFNLILRPHPYSLKVEKKLLDKIQEKLRAYNNLIWDFNPDGSDSLRAADIMISDTSGVRLDFAFVYQKPFITIPRVFSPGAMKEFEIADLGFSWTEENVSQIGYTLRGQELDNLDKIILMVLNERQGSDILEFRSKNVYNIGNSGEVIADYLIRTSRLLNLATDKVVTE